jgi:hypothetical protein
MPQINTSSGGLVETVLYRDRLHGEKLYLHIDQSTNMNNGEGDAAIHLTNREVKELIAVLNDYIIYTEGKPHVLLADPLLHPDVKIMVGEKIVEKKAEDVNPYIANEDVITPGEEGIDYDDYFKSILPKLNQ